MTRSLISRAAAANFDDAEERMLFVTAASALAGHEMTDLQRELLDQLNRGELSVAEVVEQLKLRR